MLISRAEKTALCLCLLFALAFATEECDKLKCKGPLRFYEALKCKPVFANPGDCCAVRYDCSHLSNRDPTTHCYSNGREYPVGTVLKGNETGDPCKVECRCGERNYGNQAFMCTTVYSLTPSPLPRDDCFHRHDPITCVSKIECPNEGEERTKCEFEGKSYLDGERFIPNHRLDLRCECKPGFKGELVEPFCWTPICEVEQINYSDFHKNCTPVFYKNRLPQTSCPYHYKCHGVSDQIIPATSEQETSMKTSNDMKCKYGDLLLNISDKVKGTHGYNCLLCECEIPPFATCRQIPNSECNLPIEHGLAVDYVPDAVKKIRQNADREITDF